MTQQTRYASDQEIEGYYKNATINVEFWDSLSQGHVELEFPNADDSDYLDATMINGFIIYEQTGKIAFDHWLPEILHHEICRKIRAERRRLSH